jgi:hypothetical protein
MFIVSPIKDCFIASVSMSMILLATAMTGCAQTSIKGGESHDNLRETLVDGTESIVSWEQSSPFQQSAMTQLERNPGEELFALEISYPGGGSGDVIEIAVHQNHAEVRHFTEALYGSVPQQISARKLDPSELAELRAFVAKNRVDHLARQDSGAWDGVEYRWTHACGSHGWQVVLNNPREDQHPQDELIELIKRIGDITPGGV